MFSKKNENLFFGILICLCIVLFFIGTGTLFSGYHFTDDHEFISINSELQNNALISTITRWATGDFKIRFRPLYYAIRVIEVYFFHLNFVAYSIFRMTLFMATSLLFFYGSVKLHWQKILALAFIVMSFVGHQMAIWWRLGPNETYGVFFMAIAFFFAIPNKKDKRYMFFVRNIIFMVSVILSSLCKESFVISIPAMIFFRIWIIQSTENQTFKKTVISFLPYTIILFFVFFAELLFILKFVGTNQIGYAGIDKSVLKFAKEFITSYTTGITRELLQLYGIMIFSVAFYFLCDSANSTDIVSSVKNFFAKNWQALIFAILIFAPNCILYAKSGMWERYLIPSTVAVSFFICSVINSVSTNFIKLKEIFSKAILTIFVLSAMISFRQGWSFKREGQKTAVLLSDIEKNSKNQNTVLVVAHPIQYLEWRHSIKIYLENIQNKNVFFSDKDLPENFLPDVIVGWDSENVLSYVETHFPSYELKTNDERNFPVYAEK